MKLNPSFFDSLIGIRMRCPRSGVGGRDRIHLIAWEKALRSFDLEAFGLEF